MSGWAALEKAGAAARKANDYLNTFAPAIDRFREKISPWSLLSPTDVAGFAPGGGFVQAWQDSGRGLKNLKAGNYGQAAADYGSMALNTVGELAPWAKLGMFFGPMAKTADLDLLKSAKSLADKGADARKVWDETGWFKGADDQWRFEVPDNASSFYMRGAGDFVGDPWNSKIGTHLDHSALWEAYPELRLTQSTVTQLPPDAVGNGSGKFAPGHVVVNAKNPAVARSVAMHEMQHAVQNVEGFSRGATLSDVGMNAYGRTAGEVEAANVQRRLFMTPEERRALPPWETEGVPREQQIVRYR
jgi:hypothetical protein